MKTIAQPTDQQTEIDALAKRYAERRARVRDIVDQIEDEVRVVHRKHRRALAEALATAAGCQDALISRIRDAVALFVKPKTWALHDIKLGFRKGSGKVEFDDNDTLVAKLRKKFGEDSEEFRACVEVKHVIRKDALRDLDAKHLAALGVTIEDVTDVPFVKGVETETDKLVKRLLKEATGRIPEES